jgi:uncharacterized membrane protein YGL010W
MKTGVEQLTKYAAYHRDKRNIATHFVGIPMIVLGVVILLSRPQWSAPESYTTQFSPAFFLSIVTSLYYLKLDLKLGIVMGFFLGGCLTVAQGLAMSSTTLWLAWGLGLFFVGWAFQFVGHFYEGKKPAFVDDLMGLIIGPLFVAAEAAFMLGTRKDLQLQIEAKVGPTRINSTNPKAKAT